MTYWAIEWPLQWIIDDSLADSLFDQKIQRQNDWSVVLSKVSGSLADDLIH